MCIAIIGIISLVILARYRSFNSTLLLRDLAYEIALSTREAQVYGISVEGINGFFTHVSGMHFTLGAQYILFTDLNDHNKYESGDEVSLYTIGDRKQVTALCYYTDAAPSTCNPLTALDVLFKRPVPDALFYDGNGNAIPSVSSVTVTVSAPPDSNTRTVRIRPTGQISVE